MSLEIRVWRDPIEIGEHERNVFFASNGHRGRLREAYCGEPYVTSDLVREAIASGSAEIPAAVLSERLARVLELAQERQRRVYGDGPVQLDAAQRDHVEFVSFCERMEKRLGQPVTIIASD
jgi:hypothetical protein